MPDPNEHGPYDDLIQDDPEAATPTPDVEGDLGLDLPDRDDLEPMPGDPPQGDPEMPDADDDDDGQGEEGGEDGSPVG